jgi:CubicO group peptidase (beta-lactamase class C family)
MAFDDELTARLDGLLRRAVARGRHVRHGLMGVATEDGGWQWTAAHGVLDPEGTSATPASRYPIASVTKLFTAVITMRLVESGHLGLEDRMVDHLPDDFTAGLHILDGVDRTDDITIAHLLSHTSGLPDYYEGAPRGQPSPQARLLAGEDAPVPFDEVIRLVRGELSPHFPPQDLAAVKAKARYADTNYQLLGAILERRTGLPLHQLFADHVFVPLGLDSTSSYPHPPASGASPEPEARVWAKGVVLQPGGALTHQKADGGIISTLDDQLRFMTAVVSGQVFNDPGIWPRMWTRTNRVFFPVEYGLGVMRYAPARWMSPLFPVPPLIGHTGSTATWLFHCPDLSVVVAGTFDVAQPPLPFRFVPRVLRAVASAEK